MKLKVILSFAVMALFIASTTSAQANTTFSYIGQAYAAKVDANGVIVIVANTGPLPSKGGVIEKNLDLLDLDLTALLPLLPLGTIEADLLHTKTSGGGTELWQKSQANSLAELAHLKALLPGVLNLTATAVRVTTHVRCDVSGADYGKLDEITGNSKILGLVINSTPITVTGLSNQVVFDKTALGLKVKVVLNERIKSIAYDRGTITINGIHIYVRDALTGLLKTDVIVSSAKSGIICATP